MKDPIPRKMKLKYDESEALTALVLKSSLFWDKILCIPVKSGLHKAIRHNVAEDKSLINYDTLSKADC